MTESDIENYITATTQGKFKFGLEESEKQLDYFYSLLLKCKPLLQENELSIEFKPGDARPKELYIKTPLGDIKMFTTYCLDDKFVGAAVLFTDDQVVDGETKTRKLNALFLGMDGVWSGSDGKPAVDTIGQNSPRVVYGAVMAAVAAKLKADSDYAYSFKRTERG